MKKYLIAATISLFASNAFAVSRYEITNVTCETVQALIQTEGQVILVYRSQGILGLPIYDRYVKGQELCLRRGRARGRCSDRRQEILPGQEVRRKRDFPGEGSEPLHFSRSYI